MPKRIMYIVQCTFLKNTRGLRIGCTLFVRNNLLIYGKTTFAGSANFHIMLPNETV